MENNDVLRRFRYALKIPDVTMVKIFKMAQCLIDQPQLLDLLKRKEEAGYVACTTDLLERFFDGLILYNRGEPDGQNRDKNETSSLQGQGQHKEARGEDIRPQQRKRAMVSEVLDNNVILKKIRIALDLKQEDMVEIFRLGEVNMTKGEFTALFRKKGHKNYKECGDQYLKKFLHGLAVRHRM
ncbi:MAG: DUF1456 family protein [Desulfamplus sp.]|nr:DUF1456 family protein [Desulfamplus sp.]